MAEAALERYKRRIETGYYDHPELAWRVAERLLSCGAVRTLDQACPYCNDHAAQLVAATDEMAL